MGDSMAIDILKQFLDKPIAVHPAYIRVTGSVTAGYLLAQILYWWQIQGYREFYKTNEEFCQELCMTKREFDLAKKKILPFVNITVKSLPAKTYYNPNFDRIKEALQLVGTRNLGTKQDQKVRTNQLVQGNQAQNEAKNRVPTTTENTTEKENVLLRNTEKKATLGIQELVDHYNTVFGKHIRSVNGLANNYGYWIKEGYSLDDMKKALDVASSDSFWKDKMTPVILLRRKNPQGDPVDYIGSLMDRSPEKQEKVRPEIPWSELKEIEPGYYENNYFEDKDWFLVVTKEGGFKQAHVMTEREYKAWCDGHDVAYDLMEDRIAEAEENKKYRESCGKFWTPPEPEPMDENDPFWKL